MVEKAKVTSEHQVPQGAGGARVINKMKTVPGQEGQCFHLLSFLTGSEFRIPEHMEHCEVAGLWGCLVGQSAERENSKDGVDELPENSS